MTTVRQSFSRLFRDSGGIQTHNLLIRSQMLYSVELRNLFFGVVGYANLQKSSIISDLRVQRYGLFLIPPNFFALFLEKSSFLHDYTRFMIVFAEFCRATTLTLLKNAIKIAEVIKTTLVTDFGYRTGAINK